MFVTSEYNNNNLKLDEIGKIIEKTRLEHDLKYGIKWVSQVRIFFNVRFCDKINNKIKKITTKKNYSIEK